MTENPQQHESGYVCVMKDQLNHNLIKVGFSLNPLERVRQLYSFTRDGCFRPEAAVCARAAQHSPHWS
jgi:hypothetical protein